VPDHAVYVYGVAPAGDADRLPRGTGAIDARFPLEVVQDGDLVALASEIAPSTFDRIDDQRDLSSLEQMVRAHEQVLDRAARAEALLPFRFGTVLADRSALRSLLRARGDELARQLDSLRGAHEWGVKALLERERLEEALASADPVLDELREQSAAGDGSAFFARKRLERELAERAWSEAARLAETAHERLSGCARRAVANPPQRPELSGYAGEMILNGAYLVDCGREAEFRAALTELGTELGDAVRLELTGPWPAFNFVEPALDSIR
jgi:hypothetical protein